MHDLVLVQIGHCLADFLEVPLDLWLLQHLLPQFVEQCPSVGILQDHVRGFSLPVDIMAQKLNDAGMVQLALKHNFVFG